MPTQGIALSPSEVADQVDRISASAELGRSERLKKFLKFAVTETIEGRSEQLKEYTIAVEAFDRDESFDPQTSNIVRVEAGRLRQRLNAYYNGPGRYDPIRIELPKGTYVPSIAPLVEGDNNETDTKNDLNGGSTEDLADAPYGPSIAVLPFDNMSANPERAFFADGITEEIITDLARFRDLFVIARNTTFQYRGQAVDIRKIGAELGVEFVLEGSVRTAGDTVRITAQLIDAVSGAHIWADTFDRILSPQNLLDLQDEVSGQVVSRIAQPYGILRDSVRPAQSRRAASDLSVYEAVLLFYAYWARHNPQDHLSARNALQNAVETDPSYADAWGAMALLAVDEARFGFNPLPGEGDPWERAENYAHRAIDLHPDCIIAMQALVTIYFHQRKTAEFKSLAQRALQINPNHTDMLADFGCYLSYSGDWSRGLALIDKAIALCPHHPSWYHYPKAVDHFRKGEFEKALVQVQAGEAEDFYWFHVLRAAIHGELNEPKKAAAAIERLLNIHPTFAETARQELDHWLTSEELIADIVAGLEKAGLRISDRP